MWETNWIITRDRQFFGYSGCMDSRIADVINEDVYPGAVALAPGWCFPQIGPLPKRLEAGFA